MRGGGGGAEPTRRVDEAWKSVRGRSRLCRRGFLRGNGNNDFQSSALVDPSHPSTGAAPAESRSRGLLRKVIISGSGFGGEKNLAGSVRVVRCGISFFGVGRVGKTRRSVTRLASSYLRLASVLPGTSAVLEASRERGDLARGAATTPLHATRVRTPRRFPERVTSLARPRHARRVRRAPGAARRRAGSPRGASDQRPQPPSAARRSRTRVAPLGGRARRDDARRKSSPTRRSAVVVASPASPRGRAARRGGHNPQSRLRARRAARRFVRRGGWRFLLDRPSNRRRLERAETK